jgi:hypothetical protein
MSDQDKYTHDGFTTAIVGVGALFFAYGEIYDYGFFNLRLLIALVGLGSSLILLMRSWGLDEERRGIQKKLDGTKVMDDYRNIASWRGRGMKRYFYHPVTRLITYFMGLLSVAWGLIVVSDLGYLLFHTSYPPILGFAVAFAAMVVTFTLLIDRKIRDLKANSADAAKQ